MKKKKFALNIAGATGVADRTIVLFASPDPEKKPETFVEVARISDAAPQNADKEVELQVELDASQPTWLGLKVESALYKETTDFLSFAFVPPTLAGSKPSLSLLKLRCET